MIYLYTFVCLVMIALIIIIGTKIINRKNDLFHSERYKEIKSMLGNSKTEDWYEHKRELSISEMEIKYNLDSDWYFETVSFENIYDARPTKAVFVNKVTKEKIIVDLYENI